MGSFILTSLDILIAIIGVAFAATAYYEYAKLRALREDFDNFKKQFKRELYQSQKATQRIIASYSTADPDKRIELIKSALELDPLVFNGFNALGFAYLDKNDLQQAINAFREAIYRHPGDKAGYFDLAHVYLKVPNKELALEYLKKAIEIDPSAKKDLKDNILFQDLFEDKRYKALFAQ